MQGRSAIKGWQWMPTCSGVQLREPFPSARSPICGATSEPPQKCVSEPLLMRREATQGYLPLAALVPPTMALCTALPALVVDARCLRLVAARSQVWGGAGAPSRRHALPGDTPARSPCRLSDICPDCSQKYQSQKYAQQNPAGPRETRSKARAGKASQRHLAGSWRAAGPCTAGEGNGYVCSLNMAPAAMKRPSYNSKQPLHKWRLAREAAHFALPAALSPLLERSQTCLIQ